MILNHSYILILNVNYFLSRFLQFLSMDKWLKDIGIGYVQGHSNEVKDLIKALKSTIHNP